MASLLELLGQTWPVRLAKSAVGAAALPGDVYAGRVDPLSEEGIGKAADLAGMVMGGTFAGAPRGAMGAGPIRGVADFPKEKMRPLAGALTPEQFNARVTQRLYEDMKARYGQERADAWLAKQAPAELPTGVTPISNKLRIGSKTYGD